MIYTADIVETYSAMHQCKRNRMCDRIAMLWDRRFPSLNKYNIHAREQSPWSCRKKVNDRDCMGDRKHTIAQKGKKEKRKKGKNPVCVLSFFYN